MSVVAIQEEAAAMRQTLAATRSGQFARVVLIRDGGIAHRVIYDSNRGGHRLVTIDADPARARANRRGESRDWRKSARWLILFSLIMFVVMVAAHKAFLS